MVHSLAIYDGLHEHVSNFGTKYNKFCSSVDGTWPNLGNKLEPYKSQLEPEYLIENTKCATSESVNIFQESMYLVVQ
jgi:hypothetical protein